MKYSISRDSWTIVCCPKTLPVSTYKTDFSFEIKRKFKEASKEEIPQVQKN